MSFCGHDVVVLGVDRVDGGVGSGDSVGVGDGVGCIGIGGAVVTVVTVFGVVCVVVVAFAVVVVVIDFGYFAALLGLMCVWFR